MGKYLITYKLTWDGRVHTVNGRREVYYTPQSATLYASPYLVATPQGYTKHYYAGAERVASQMGRGKFSDVNTSIAGSTATAAKKQAVLAPIRNRQQITSSNVQFFAYLNSLTNRQNDTSECYFYHPDHLGSSSWITDSAGTAVQHLHYLPFGENFVDQKSNSFDGVRYTFSAKEKDTETGYSYFGSRYYSSDLSIWLSVDPQASKYPSLSPYVYCANNPIKLVDPNGEEIDDNLDKWKYNKDTKELTWLSDEGGRYHQIVVETENTPSGEKVNRMVEFDGAIGQMFDFSVVSKTVDGIISGALEMCGGATTVMAGAVIATEGSFVSGGVAFPVGAAIFSAGAYQSVNGLITIANAVAGRGVDMYEQQDIVRDICKSAGNSVAGILSGLKQKPFTETLKNTFKTVSKSIASFSMSAAWSTALRYRTTHPKCKGIPSGSKVY